MNSQHCAKGIPFDEKDLKRDLFTKIEQSACMLPIEIFIYSTDDVAWNRLYSLTSSTLQVDSDRAGLVERQTIHNNQL